MSTRLREIDFIKGVAIISVLLLHTLSSGALEVTHNSLHIGQAVPLFLFSTFYLTFIKIDRNSKNILSYYYSLSRLKRIINDVAIPFFSVVAIQIVISLYVDKSFPYFTSLLWGLLGRGPGNYYFWVYLQLWVLIPFLFIILTKMKRIGMMAILVVCILLNIIIYNCEFTTFLYRLSFFRYLFLSVPAFILYDLEKKKSKKYSLILFVMFSFIYLISIRKYDFTPCVLDYGWEGEQWPSFFWSFFIFILLKYYGYRLCGSRLLRLFEKLGRNSWYIFLAQMLLLTYFRIDHLEFIGYEFLRRVVFILLVFIISLSPIMLSKLRKT